MDMSEIDFANFGLQIEDNSEIGERQWSDIGKELLEAFTTNGFAIVVNHGIERQMMDELNEASNDFFSNSLEYKMKFHTKKLLSYHPTGLRAEGAKMANYSEGLGFPCYESGCEWPDVPHLKKRVRNFQKKCKVLMFRVLKALGVAMNLMNADLLERAHCQIGQEGNWSLLKLIYYPPITTTLPENHKRFREHKDVGSVTMLFRDGIGGLQQQTDTGDFVDVPVVPGSIILQIGQSLEYWTGGRLKAATHRVIVPNEDRDKSRARKSIAFFALIDNDVLLDSSVFEGDSPQYTNQKQEAITAGEYAEKEIRARRYFK